MMSDRQNLLAQKMRDLQIHRHEIELKKLRSSPSDLLATSLLRALDAALAAADIIEAYIISLPLGFGREPGWSIALFSESQLPAEQQIEMIVAAQEASESFEITIEIFCWQENALQLAEAMATGIRIWPRNHTLHKDEQL